MIKAQEYILRLGSYLKMDWSTFYEQEIISVYLFIQPFFSVLSSRYDFRRENINDACAGINFEVRPHYNLGIVKLTSNRRNFLSLFFSFTP